MSDCKNFSEKISLYIDNALTPEERYKFENHLKNCPSCKEEYLEIKNIVDIMHEEPLLDLPENFHEETMEKLAKENIKYKFKFNKYINIAASLILVLFCTNFLMSYIYNINLNNNFTNSNLNEQKPLMKTMDINPTSNSYMPETFSLQDDNIKNDNYNLLVNTTKLKKLKDDINIDNLNLEITNNTIKLNTNITKEQYNKILDSCQKYGTIVLEQHKYLSDDYLKGLQTEIDIYKDEKKILQDYLNNSSVENDKFLLNSRIEEVNGIINELQTDINNIDKDIINLDLTILQKNNFYSIFTKSFSKTINFTSKILNIQTFILFLILCAIYFTYNFLKNRRKKL